MKNPYLGRNIKPIYPPCEECLFWINEGILEWETHINRDHLGRSSGIITSMLGGETIPFIKVLRDEVRGKFCLVPTQIEDIIAQLKDEIPAQYHHFLEIGVRLAIARARQETEMLEKRK